MDQQVWGLTDILGSLVTKYHGVIY